MSNLINGATQEMVQAVKNNVTDIVDGTTPAGKVKGKLTIGDTTYDGSADVTVNMDASKLYAHYLLINADVEFGNTYVACCGWIMTNYSNSIFTMSQLESMLEDCGGIPVTGRTIHNSIPDDYYPYRMYYDADEDNVYIQFTNGNYYRIINTPSIHDTVVNL